MTDRKRFVNRELSWLRFNSRVMLEAERPHNPPLERAKFLSIVSSNLDEFFMVRVGKLETKVDQKLDRPGAGGMTPARQLEIIWHGAREQVAKQYKLYREALLPALAAGGLHLLKLADLTEEQHQWLSHYFDAQIAPVLTPRVLNAKYPFPLLTAKRLHIAVQLRSPREKGTLTGLIPVPGALKRLVMLPMGPGQARGVLLEDVIGYYVQRMYPEMEVAAHLTFRLTRNTDFALDITSADKILEEMMRNIKRRAYGKIVRVEVAGKGSGDLLARLLHALEVPEDKVLKVNGPLDLTFLSKQVRKLPGFEEMRYQKFSPRVMDRLTIPETIFRTIRQGDLLFHHPYDSYDPIVRFIAEAADDERVLAIRQTLYRVSSSSPFIASLARAAQKGKQVTVLVEVRARFDEENNIAWCKALEKAGCQVIYGLPNWKTHSKIAIVVRQEETGIRHYLHLGTGNYNDATAKGYTDLSILTADSFLAEDAGAFFSIVTGYSDTFDMKELIASPFFLRQELETRIHREKEHAAKGRPALIVAKMNSLSDKHLIALLVEAAEAGVRIYLSVRGICCLKVPKNGNIVVRSIVGRYLEHARIFIFHDGGRNETFISSADWMPRNLDRRLELTAPVKDPSVSRAVREIAALEFMDDSQSWEMLPDGRYERVGAGDRCFSSQEQFMQAARRSVDFDSVFHVSSS